MSEQKRNLLIEEKMAKQKQIFSQRYHIHLSKLDGIKSLKGGLIK